MSNTTERVSAALLDYVRKMGVREHPVLTRLRRTTSRMTAGQMQISPEQGALMALLVELIGARRAIEVGTFTGYSSLAIALALPKDGQIVACDVSRPWTDIARAHWKAAKVERKIDLRIGPATATLDAMLASGGAGRYDFAFIDADKANYDAYYERALRLLRPGGLMAIDNVLWGGSVIDQSKQSADTKAIRAINKKIARDKRVHVALVPIGDGLTLARKL
jgi:predicted O-methyltransferase YrrM